MKLLWDPCLELTFNHGTDVEEGPSYHNGSDPMYAGAAAPQGFAKLGYLVDDLETFVTALQEAGVVVEWKASEGSARVRDPTGYVIDIVQRGTGPTVV